MAPWVVASLPGRATAAEYASAGEAIDAIDRLEAEAAGRLAAISAALPSARPFISSALTDQAKQRGERARLRQRLGLALARPPAASSAEPDLAGLRAAQEALVYAHAEGLPAWATHTRCK